MEPSLRNPIIDFYNKLKNQKIAIKFKSSGNWNSIKAHHSKLHFIMEDWLNKLSTTPVYLQLNDHLKHVNLQIFEFLLHLAFSDNQREKAKWMSHGEDDIMFLYSKIYSGKYMNNVSFNIGVFGPDNLMLLLLMVSSTISTPSLTIILPHILIWWVFF